MVSLLKYGSMAPFAYTGSFFTSSVGYSPFLRHTHVHRLTTEMKETKKTITLNSRASESIILHIASRAPGQLFYKLSVIGVAYGETGRA